MPGVVVTSAPTPGEVRQRIIDICVAITTSTTGVLKYVELDDTCSIPEGLLPALVNVSPRGIATTERESKDITRVTRNYELAVLLHEIKSKSKTDQLEARDAMWTLIDELADWFSRNAFRLELDRVPLRGVVSTGRMVDQGEADGSTPWANKVYAAVIYTLPVTTSR